MGQTHHVGALFEALNQRVLTAASDLTCIFFTIKNILQAHCEMVRKDVIQYRGPHVFRERRDNLLDYVRSKQFYAQMQIARL